jgi:hypothetical protein
LLLWEHLGIQIISTYQQSGFVFVRLTLIMLYYDLLRIIPSEVQSTFVLVWQVFFVLLGDHLRIRIDSSNRKDSFFLLRLSNIVLLFEFFLFCLIRSVFQFVFFCLFKCPLLNFVVIFWYELVCEVHQNALASFFDNWSSDCFQWVTVNLDVLDAFVLAN